MRLPNLLALRELPVMEKRRIGKNHNIISIIVLQLLASKL